MAQPNWVKIRARYEKGGISYRKLADECGVSFNTLKGHATKEGWRVSRDAVHHKTTTKTQQILVERGALEAADYINQHTDDWQSLRTVLMEVINADFAKLTEDQVDWLKSKASFAIAASQTFDRIQKGQRLSLGLDKPEPPKPPEEGQGVVILPQKDMPTNG